MKKLLILTGVLLLAVGLTAFIVRQFAYTPSCNGVDLSRWNDIRQIQQIEGLDFVIAKASEGTTIIDPKFQHYRNYARQNNIKFGAYHFLSQSSDIDEQFNHFSRIVGKNIDLIPCVDVEKSQNGREWTRKEARSAVRKWSDLCKQFYGKEPIIYCNDFYRIAYFHDFPNQFWINNWHCRPFTDCAIHQYTNNNETINFNHLITDIENILL